MVDVVPTFEWPSYKQMDVAGRVRSIQLKWNKQNYYGCDRLSQVKLTFVNDTTQNIFEFPATHDNAKCGPQTLDLTGK